MRRSHHRSRAHRRCRPYDITEHHRRPRSRGGQKILSNISLVRRYKHEAWHLLFDNLPVNQIVERFQFFYEVFGTEDSKTEKQGKLIKEWIFKSEPRIKKWNAWRCIFGNMSLRQILSEINRIWIDPRYRLYVQMEQVEKPKISAVKMN